MSANYHLKDMKANTKEQGYIGRDLKDQKLPKFVTFGWSISEVMPRSTQYYKVRINTCSQKTLNLNYKISFSHFDFELYVVYVQRCNFNDLQRLHTKYLHQR